MMRISFRTLRYLLLLSSACLLVISCRNKRGDEEDENRVAPSVTVSVQTMKVVEGDAILTIKAFGKTDALRKEKIYAPIAGKVVSLSVYEGSEVRKGDVIAQILSKESQSAILGAESMLKSASTPAQKAEAEQALKLAKSTQNRVSIIARFEGYVSARNVSEGELVVENGELLTIIDPTTINFLADVQLHDLPAIRLNQTASVEFQALPGRKFTAIVKAINPQSDIQSQTVKIRLQFISDSNLLRSSLRTEMMGTAHIVIGVRKHALFVPASALLRNDEENTYTVVTVTPDSLARIIPVVRGTMNDSLVEVQSPLLHAGTPVITVGNYSLNDSTRVTTSRQENE